MSQFCVRTPWNESMSVWVTSELQANASKVQYMEFWRVFVLDRDKKNGWCHDSIFPIQADCRRSRYFHCVFSFLCEAHRRLWELSCHMYSSPLFPAVDMKLCKTFFFFSPLLNSVSYPAVCLCWSCLIHVTLVLYFRLDLFKWGSVCQDLSLLRFLWLFYFVVPVFPSSPVFFPRAVLLWPLPLSPIPHSLPQVCAVVHHCHFLPCLVCALCLVSCSCLSHSSFVVLIFILMYFFAAFCFFLLNKSFSFEFLFESGFCILVPPI